MILSNDLPEELRSFDVNDEILGKKYVFPLHKFYIQSSTMGVHGS